MAFKDELSEDTEPLGEPPSFTMRPEEQVERNMWLPTRLGSFFKLCKSQSGFSLAELMVTAGVAGTLALGTMKLAQLHTQAQITDEILTAQQTTQIMLKNSKACTNTFAGENIAGFAGGNGNYDGGVSHYVDIDEIKNPNNTNFLTVSPGAATIASGLPADEEAIDRSDTYVVYGNIVMVQHIRITNVRSVAGKDKEAAAGVNRAGIAEVEIMFAIKNNRRGAGNKIIRYPKHILFPISFNQAGVILECRMPEDIGVQETEKDMCEELGGSFDLATNRCTQAEEVMTDRIKEEVCTQLGGSFSVTNDSCVPNYYGCSCPTGSHIIGFNSDSDPSTRGRPRCYDPVAGDYPAPTCVAP